MENTHISRRFSPETYSTSSLRAIIAQVNLHKTLSNNTLKVAGSSFPVTCWKTSCPDNRIVRLHVPKSCYIACFV